MQPTSPRPHLLEQGEQAGSTGRALWALVSPCTNTPSGPRPTSLHFTPQPIPFLPSQANQRGKWAETSNVTERGLLFPSAGQTSSPGAGGRPCRGTRELLGQLSTHSKQGHNLHLHTSHASHARTAPPAKLSWKGTYGFCILLTPPPLFPLSVGWSTLRFSKCSKKPASLSQSHSREHPPSPKRPAT